MVGKTYRDVYRVLELVGAGGFADVFLGRDLRSNTVVAVQAPHWTVLAGDRLAHGTYNEPLGVALDQQGNIFGRAGEIPRRRSE